MARTTPPAAPDYGDGGLAAVLPTAAASLGVTAARTVVVLIDGLGYDLLVSRSGHAPFLRSHLPRTRRITAGYPSTTATSMATFGTGLPPGGHGLLGYLALDPARDVVFNELAWDDGPVPEQWQPSETVFERAAANGVAVTRIGPGFFDGSGLTRAALRGGRFVAAQSLDDRIDATLAALRRDRRALVYLYWGDLDKVGHVHGCSSWQWGEELEAIDAGLRRLAASVPPDCSIHITADHGMVDVPHSQRIDLADDPELDHGIRKVAGEPRAVHLHCAAGAADDVLATWAERLGERAWVRSGEEAVAAGWFGPLADHNRDRVPDVIAAMSEAYAVVDSRILRPEVLALLGLHGSLTDAEMAVPWVHVPARQAT